MAVSLTAALLGLLGAGSASAQVPAASAAYQGYASGIDVHTGALTSGTTTLAEVDQAFSGSAVNTPTGLGTAIADTDLLSNPAIQVAAPGKNSGARGSGVEVGVLPSGSPLTNQIILEQEAFATAPPNTSADHSIPLNLNPLISADLLEGKALANWATGGCILGEPISQGEGDATNLQVAGGPSAPLLSSVGVSHTISNETLVPQVNSAGTQVGDAVGLMSQVIETVAPVTIGSGLTAVTITVVGPWRLQAVATGIAGASYVGYGPTDPAVLNNSAPALSIQTEPQALLGTATNIYFSQLLGANGLQINLPGIANLDIGAPPHAIGDPTAPPVVSADGTNVSAAADIVRVTASLGTLNLADVRVGHTIASATAPAGGISCPIPVTKSANPATVNPGDHLTYSIVVTNPYQCTLSNVKVVDTTTASSGVQFVLTSATPTPNTIIGGTVTFNNAATLAPGGSETLTINVSIPSSSSGGTLTDNAVVTGTCGLGNAAGTATVNVGLNGSTVLATTIGGRSGALPVTGGLTGRYYAVALLVGLAAVAFGRRGLHALFASKA